MSLETVEIKFKIVRKGRGRKVVVNSYVTISVSSYDAADKCGKSMLKAPRFEDHIDRSLTGGSQKRQLVGFSVDRSYLR